VFLETCAESVSPGDALSTKMTENISAMLHRAAKNGQLSILEKFRDLSALSSRGLWDLSYAIDLATSCQVFPEDGKLMKFRLSLVQTILEIPNLSPRTYTEGLKIAITQKDTLTLTAVLNAMESAKHIERFAISLGIEHAVKSCSWKGLQALLARPLLLSHLDPSDTEIMRNTLIEACAYPEAFASLFDALHTSACKDCCQEMLGIALAKIHAADDPMHEDRKKRLEEIVYARSHLLTQHDREVIARKRKMDLGWGDALSQQDLLGPVLEQIDKILEENAKLQADLPSS